MPPMTSPDRDATSNLADEADYAAYPGDMPWHSIVTLLAPMFVGADVGDPGRGRLAAMETIASYGARTQVELMQVAQIIGFSLAAMDNLASATADDVPLAMKLRLRSGAVALNRAAQQNARVLEKLQRLDPPLEQSIAEQAEEAGRRPGGLAGEDRGSEVETGGGTVAGRATVEEVLAAIRETGDSSDSIGRPHDAPPGIAQIEEVIAPAERGGPMLRTAPMRQIVEPPALSGEQQRKRMWARAMETVAATLSAADFGNLSPSGGRPEAMWAGMSDFPASELAPGVEGIRLPMPAVTHRAQELAKPP